MAKEYTVLSITEMTRLSDTQGIERYYRHRIRTAGRVVLTVDIDEADFVAEKAGPILQNRAQIADKILKL